MKSIFFTFFFMLCSSVAAAQDSKPADLAECKANLSQIIIGTGASVTSGVKVYTEEELLNDVKSEETEFFSFYTPISIPECEKVGAYAYHHAALAKAYLYIE